MSGVAIAGKTDGNWVSQEQSFDAQRGWELVDVYRGTEQAMGSLQSAFNTYAGVRTRLSRPEGSPVWTLEVTKPSIDYAQGGSGTTTETPVEKWELKTEMVQLSIWNHHTVSAFFTTAGRALAAGWKKGILDAIKNGEDVATAIRDEHPTLTDSVFNLLLLGSEAYEVKRHTLSRTKTYSALYSERATVNATEIYYTTAQLTSVFAVPALLASKLPSNPTTKPAETAWGWRMRTNSQVYVRGTGKVDEVTDWVFAAWSTFLYAAYA